VVRILFGFFQVFLFAPTFCPALKEKVLLLPPFNFVVSRFFKSKGMSFVFLLALLIFWIEPPNEVFFFGSVVLIGLPVWIFLPLWRRAPGLVGLVFLPLGFPGWRFFLVIVQPTPTGLSFCAVVTKVSLCCLNTTPAFFPIVYSHIANSPLVLGPPLTTFYNHAYFFFPMFHFPPFIPCALCGAAPDSLSPDIKFSHLPVLFSHSHQYYGVFHFFPFSSILRSPGVTSISPQPPHTFFYLPHIFYTNSPPISFC